MASAQVLRKQEHLEAGKKKLEEFRKKKAADRAKKPTSTSQLQASNGGLQEKQLSESEHGRLTDSNGAGTSGAVDGAIYNSSALVANNDVKDTLVPQKSDFNSSSDTGMNHAFSGNYYSFNSSFPASSESKQKDSGDNAASESAEAAKANYYSEERRGNGGASRNPMGVTLDKSMSIYPSLKADERTSSRSSYEGSEEALSSSHTSYLKDSSPVNPHASHALSTNTSPENTVSILQNTAAHIHRSDSTFTSSSYQDYVQPTSSLTNTYADRSNNHGFSGNGESQFSGSASTNDSSMWPSDSRYAGFSYSERGSSALAQESPPTLFTTGRKYRTSFLDSINIPRAPSASTSGSGPIISDMSNSKVHPVDALGSSALQSAINPIVTTANGIDSLKNSAEKVDSKPGFYSQKQNEDFAALEQHIEDLTQEKFSLQRALEASRVLAESLATENSALTDSYNQQGTVVSQLKADMEKLQEEIKAQLVELEAVKMEYATAQLECNAADERAKLLASEVIGLEEKALRLRSNELKLERQLENSQAEMSSFKKRMSSLQKERQDLQSTIDALQEEKKLLQSKLRKASGGGKSLDVSKTMDNRKDVSTSTEDLGEIDTADASMSTTNLVASNSYALGIDAPGVPYTDENRHFNLETLSLTVPPDQMRMIQNIDTLISELALEKEDLIKALSLETSECSKLKELNKDLTRKLEVQTQRLELLTAQSMANDNSVPARPLDSHIVNDNAAYADEGDEVVERVLGWIMKLFPGGPSRRRTSKLL